MKGHKMGLFLYPTPSTHGRHLIYWITPLISYRSSSVAVIAGLSLAIYHGSANAQNKIAIEHTGVKDIIANTNKTSIVLVHLIS
jgi:hypothetical protein